ncbi:hypothetical protein AMJ87_10785 [candidate division WOR_3 bacterium SM23_60]|uniref:Glycosyl transferase family 1 domain-containing protein n=1 Tax=candidate division WOR_3 bacterium SM23_60 TaxID=1703780 RepID=A0A0S8G8P3_UNCW3|nr:MAG: hypothetical protein AMJ87_10785 [candidate division WOR_3 bacterium SM23_60]
MHLGLLIYGNLATLSGGFIYDRLICDHLVRQEDTVTIISLPWHSEVRTVFHNVSAALGSRLKNANIDLLIEDELNHPSCFLLNRKLKRQINYPIVALVHHLRSCEKHPWITRSYYASIEHLYLHSVDAFIYNGTATRSTVESIVGKKPAVVAHPGKDRLHTTLSPQAIRRRTRAAKVLRILFVGNVIKRKGLHTLLRALAEIDCHAWTLTVVGNTRIDELYVATIQRYIHKKKLKKSVTFLGTITDRELISHFSNHDILVVPSSYEGLGIIYTEALAFGVPSIGTTSGGAREIIQHGVTGFLVPPDRPAILGQYLQKIANDRTLLAQLSLAARSAYELHPTWSETAHTIRKFLKNLSA